MKAGTYTIGNSGTLEKVDRETFVNLLPGTVLKWGGNRASVATRYCVLKSEDGLYHCYNMDRTDQNARLNRVESYSIKDPSGDHWHTQHYFLQSETVDISTLEEYRKDHEQQAIEWQAEKDAAKAEADRLEALGRELWPELIGDCPAVIVAENHEDKSDSMTDYYASSVKDTVILAPSKHTRRLFSEMRKAAVIIPETEHLGKGKGIFRPQVVFDKDQGRHYKGQLSPWHSDLSRTFTTEAEAKDYINEKGKPSPITDRDVTLTLEWRIREDDIEHREDYSMGRGYYLAAGSTYSGWQVMKKKFYSDPKPEDYINLAKRHEHL